MYSSLLGISGALDLDIFEKPAISDFFSSLPDPVCPDFPGGRKGDRTYNTNTEENRTDF
jgi:hypothetical protein